MNAVPIGFRDVHDVGAPRHAGVVHEDIDAPIVGDRAIDHALDVGEAAGIGGESQGAMLVRRQRLSHFLDKRAVDIDRDYDGAGFGKRLGGSRADPLARTRH